MNRGFCENCGNLVTAEREERENQVFLVKLCPDCGRTETLISNDAERYNTKRRLDRGAEEPTGCGLNCLDCGRKNQPSFVFMDITNRCNSNCPICINNTPSMGFLFEPPMEYFERILAEFAEFDPKPAVQLFGGEPTVRTDLFDIISLAQSHGLATRVVTNGLKLANEDYCRKLVDSGATILIAFDCWNRETYRVLRGNEKHLDLKLEALDNLKRLGARKVALMTCVARGFNDDELPNLLEACHDRWDFVRGIYFLPLAETWSQEELDVKPERITNEDLEIMLNDCFPQERIDFVPAGIFGNLKAVLRCPGSKPPPFAGAHCNCESLYVLVSNGEEYVPLNRYLRGSLPDLVDSLIDADVRLERLEQRIEKSITGRILKRLGLDGAWLRLRAMLKMGAAVRKHVRLPYLLKGRGVAKLWHLLATLLGLAFGKSSRKVLKRHTTWQGVLQIIVLPFEDNATLETERLERCPNAFVYYDPAEDQVGWVPTCAWGLHKVPVMRRVAEFYAQQEQPAETATGS